MVHQNIVDRKRNLGGPSEKTCRKRQPGYTVSSGVIKRLIESFHYLCDRERAVMIDSDAVKVIPVCVSNDGNPLKPGIRYGERLKRNVGLDVKFDASFLKSNPQHFKNVITEVLLSYITTLDDDDALPIATDYITKAGKSTNEMKEYFTERIKVLQMCLLCEQIQG